MTLFCMIVLMYLIVFIIRVGVAAYHKSGRYKSKENNGRYHLKDEYRSALINHENVIISD